MRQRFKLSSCIDHLLLSAELSTHSLQFFPLLHIDDRISEVEFLYRFHNGCCNDEPGKPFVVSWHHEPRCAFRRGSPNCFLESVLVVVPKLTLVHVGG